MKPSLQKNEYKGRATSGLGQEHPIILTIFGEVIQRIFHILSNVLGFAHPKQQIFAKK